MEKSPNEINKKNGISVSQYESCRPSDILTSFRFATNFLLKP